MQKFFDQSISCNWSYNPTHFDNNEVPMSVMIQDMLMTYKLGWKTSYYQNTYDLKVDDTQSVQEVSSESTPNSYEPETENTTKPTEEETECESCVI